MRAAFLIVVLLLPIIRVSAQPGGAIAYGQTVSGQISDDAFRVVYTFDGAMGEIIDAQMVGTRGDLDPVLILLDADNAVVAHDDDAGSAGGSNGDAGRFAARLNAVPLPRDGLYFLVATRFGQDRGITEGDFTLRLNRVGVVSDPRLESGAILLRLGDSVVRQLDNARPQDIFTFTALRGDLVSITVSRISGDLDPVLILADADGNTILISDDDPQQPGTLNAAIREWRVPRSGNYLVAAMRFGGEAGASRGGYTLTLERATPDNLGGSADRALWLEEGEVASGRIDREQVQRFYAFQASA
ncbi:MAG: PPC domain-containing protein, partial [Anaerolineae bacterium]|nr:PPC domain-containing protein [Anaerolineae bacterium]